MEDLISVIVPVYNVEQYLERCLNTIINQTYKYLEIILIDDGSIDNSGKICDQFALKDKRIKVIHKKNEGVSQARNLGLDVATGKYISYIDSDDFIAFNMLETMLKDIKRKNADISIIKFKKVGDFCSSNMEVCEEYKEGGILDKEIVMKSVFSENCIGNYPWNKLYKKSLFEGIRYPIGREMEDLGTTYLLFDKAEKIVLNECMGYYYYQREGSILHNVNEKLLKDKFHLSLERYNYVKIEYPKLLDNYIDMLKNIFEVYQYMSNEKNMIEQTKIVLKDYNLYLKVKCFFNINYKYKLKMLVFLFNKGIFKKVFKKNFN